MIKPKYICIISAQDFEQQQKNGILYLAKERFAKIATIKDFLVWVINKLRK